MKMANSWCWQNDRRSKTMNPVGGVRTGSTAVKHRTAASLTLYFMIVFYLMDLHYRTSIGKLNCSDNDCGKIQTQDHEMSTNSDPQPSHFSVFIKAICAFTYVSELQRLQIVYQLSSNLLKTSYWFGFEASKINFPFYLYNMVELILRKCTAHL